MTYQDLQHNNMLQQGFQEKDISSDFTDAQQALMDAFIRLNQIMPRYTIKVSHICKHAFAVHGLQLLSL